MKKFDKTINQTLEENLKEQLSIGFKEIWNNYSKRKHIHRNKIVISAVASLLLLIGINYYMYANGLRINFSNLQSKNYNSFITSSSSAALLIWNDEIYYITMIEVPYDNIGKEIGEITSKTTILKQNGESNSLFPGIKLYEIVDVNTKHRIAIKEGDKYFEAHTEQYLKSIGANKDNS